MVAQNMSPEEYAQQQALTRQQQMATLLMQQGTQQPQGQMVSGRYVPTSFFQNLVPLANIAASKYVGQKADTEQAKLAGQLRQRYSDEIKEFRNLMQGGENQTPNIQGAYDFAASAYNPALQAAGLRKLTEGPIKVGLEDALIDPVTMKPVFTGAGKPRAPLQIDTGTAIELRDPANPTVVLQRIPKSQMPTAGQVSEDGSYLIDTRTGRTTPITGQGGQPLTGGGKPLTEAQGNSVAFGARAIAANQIATDLEKQGFRNTGAIRTAIGGIAGMTPFVGEQLEQGVKSTFNVLPSIAGGTSPEQQQVEQARRNFVSAVLRKESGAAIGVDEYKNEERKYFPQAGDTDKVIKQKQEARKLAIEALKAQAGPSGVRQINQITSQTQSGGNVVDFNQLPAGR
jgi:hypothetical protein